MGRALAITLIVVGGIFVGCGDKELEGCRNHGGVTKIGDDATNSNVLVACKDGTIVKVDM